MYSIWRWKKEIQTDDDDDEALYAVLIINRYCFYLYFQRSHHM